MKTYFLLAAFLLICSFSSRAQVGVGTTTPNTSSILDISSTSKGVLFPRLTRSQMMDIQAPATGLMLFCNDCTPSGIWMYDGGWIPMIPTIPGATFTAGTINCTTGSLAGDYFIGQPMNESNIKTVKISPATAGTFTASTNDNNGVAFSNTLMTLTTGSNLSFQLYGSGTPTTVGTFPYTVTISGQTCMFNVSFLSSTSGGTAVVNGYDCTGANSGSLSTGIPSTGFTHSITANVTTAGTYNISTNTINGVTFTATGTFSGTGPQNVILTANGTPSTYGNNTWTINGTPTCSFDVFTSEGSSGGSAVVSIYDCSGADAGTLTVGVAASGVTHVITATVITVGTYTFSIVQNGITFAASGTFPGTGAQNVMLTATGTPTTGWGNTFTLNTNPSCSFIRLVSPAGTFKCADAVGTYTPGGTLLLSNTSYSGTYTLPYTSGNGTAYGAATIPGSNGYGLTLTRVPGTYAAGGGNVVYIISGTTPGLLGYEYVQFSVSEGCNTSVLEPFVINFASGFNQPYSVVTDAYGNTYIGDTNNHCIKKITNGTVSVFAGSGVAGFADGAGAATQFNHPTGLYLDNAGNVYVADTDNHRIRKITSAGVVTTLAGSGTAGSANGTGTAAQFNQPWDIVLDGSGNMFISDRSNHKIRKMTPALVVSNFAGSGTAGFNNGTGTAAQFNNPAGMAIDASGNIYLADAVNNRIRKITSAAVVTTFAGSGTAGAAEGTGAAAQFNSPNDVALDGSGNLYIADVLNHKIRFSTPGAVVTTAAGSGVFGFINGYHSTAKFNSPYGVTVDVLGRVIIADSGNNALRVFTP